MTYSATYSPEDNKLRLSASSRLDAETYARVKAAGFSWAPKQEIFVAPMWTPGREDLCIELAGEIDDEDTSLVARAEQRAERFEDYSDSRKEDAERAHSAVSAIADGIPMGQPILIGHHSEKHARRDAEKIENGMRRAIKMWDTAQYWKSRAAGAIAHAKYKELPAVRARRIKGLESDLRKQEKYRDTASRAIKVWETLNNDGNTIVKMKDGSVGTFLERARWVAGNLPGCNCGVSLRQPDSGYAQYWDAFDVLQPDEERYQACPSMTPEAVRESTLRAQRTAIARYDRWIAHYTNRLEYESAMLAESGGTVAQRTGPEKGGACRCWASPHGGWSIIQKVNKVSVTLLDNWGNGGQDFRRVIEFDKLEAIMAAADVQAARDAGRVFDETKRGFMLTNAGESTPAPGSTPDATAPSVQIVSAALSEVDWQEWAENPLEDVDDEDEDFESA